jgi:hypothetical protein
MRPQGNWFAALAFFSLCTLAFAAYPSEALPGEAISW